MAKYILAIDQGTTSSRSIIFDESAKPLAALNQEFEQIYPNPGWVEHRAHDIWNSQMDTVKGVLKSANVDPSDIAAIGITNQRETTIIWDKSTGEPIMNAICWQCRRTASICDDSGSAAGGPRSAKRPVSLSTPISLARRSSGCSTMSLVPARRPTRVSCFSAP